MGMISTWINAFTKPQETLSKEKKNATIMEGAKNYALVGLVFGLLFGVILAVFAGALGASIPGMGWLAGLGVLAIVIMPIAMILFMVVGTLIGAAITHVVAKLLGGTGKLEQLYYLTSIWMVPALVVSMVVQIIPVIGAILSFAIGIYAIYLNILTVKETYGFSTLRAIAVMILPLVVIFVLLFVLLMAVGLTASAMGSSA